MKLNAREAAAMLSVSETKLYRWVDEGEIPFVMLQHQPLFHRLELLEWAMDRDIPISVDLYEDPTDAPLATALELGGGHVMTATGGLGQLADDLPIDRGDSEVIRAVLSARGHEMFQVRDGIAIPTPRSPVICPQLPPMVMLWWCRQEPIVLGDSTATAIFAITTPTILDHLQLLSRLLLVLRDDGFVQAVRGAASIATVIDEARRVGQVIEVAKSGRWSTPR